jgi:hypothetical protein
MTELEKIEYAKSFIDKLANGVNPIDDSAIPDSEVVNNVRISRCFFYVSDILRHVIENGGISCVTYAKVSEKKSQKHHYYFMPEHAEHFEYSNTPITATEIINRIVSVGPQEGVKQFPKKNFTKWLVSLGLLEDVSINGKRFKRPTESGEEIGILLEERWGQHGRYCVVLYNREAQQFIIDNIEAMLAFDGKVSNSESNSYNQSGIKIDSRDDTVSLSQKSDNKEENTSMLKRAETAPGIGHGENDLSINVSVKTETPGSKTTISKTHISDFDANVTQQEVNCHSCRFARSGDCFPQKELCSDYQKAYDVPPEEKAAWPVMGDASYLRQKGRHR